MMDDEWIGGGEREDGNARKTWGDVQVITQHARTENAHCEEVTTQIRIAAENASDCLVAVFFAYVRRREKGQLMQRRGADGLPFLATMFHAVGLNVIDARERKRDVLDVSTRALKDMIAMSWLRTTEPLRSGSCTSKILRTLSPYNTTPLTSASWYWAS